MTSYNHNYSIKTPISPISFIYLDFYYFELSSPPKLYCCGQESIRRNGAAIIVIKSPKWSTWVQSQK